MSLRAAIVLACPLALLTGCGNSRTPVPNLALPAAPGGFHLLSVPGAGLTIAAPNSWVESQARAPLVAVMSSGSAVVAVWRFRALRPPPASRAAPAARRVALIRAVRARHQKVELIRARTLTLGGARAIELDALEQIGGQLRQVRSTHLFLGRFEIVLDEYAPLGQFRAVDRAVFSPLMQSVALVRAARGVP